MDKGLSSPVSVVGFSCESSDLPSPRSTGSGERPSAEGLRSVSLLSLLLSAHQRPAEHCGGSAAEDCYEDDEEDCYEDDEDFCIGSRAPQQQGEKPTSERQMSALERAATAPMEVPSTIWLREPQAQNELRRLWAERAFRRAQLEAQHQQQQQAQAAAALQQQQMRSAYQHPPAYAAAH